MSAKTAWRVLLIMLLGLIVARFLVVGQAKVLFNQQSSDGDESAYLELALALREHGTLSDGTRPPLYPLLLAPVAARTWDYFTAAKMLTLLIGAMTLLAVFWVGLKLFGWEVGLLAVFMLGANREFHLRATTIYADTLLVLLFVLAWYFLIRSFERRRFGALAGLFVGLAYLTKGSATLLLAAWGLTALVIYRQRLLAHLQLLWPVPLVFLLVTLPLLIFNTSNFGSPFYNFATTHVMWMDRWAESQVANPADLPTLSTYLQSHSPAQMAERLREGIADLNPELAVTLIPSRTLEPAWLGPLLLLTAGLALAGLLLTRRDWLAGQLRRRHIMLWLSLFLLALYYLSSAWYAPVLIESRFLIPLLGPVYLLLAAAVIGGGRALVDAAQSRLGAAPGRWLQGSAAVLVGLALIAGVWWLAASTQTDAWSLTVNPFTSDRAANTEPESLLGWLARDFPAERGPARVVFGPSKSLPLWKFPPQFQFERIPVEVENWPAMQEYLAQSQPEYLIVDSDTARRRRQALSGYFSYTDNGIAIERLPQDWILTYLHNAGPPYTWSIFTPFRQPMQPVSASFADEIKLVGYDLVEDTANRQLLVALYWQATTDISTDYTAFLHLTAPDGFVKAQQDRLPFNGEWPTSSWRKGDVLADRFEIPLDDSIAPGRYLLLTGFYRPESGERLPLLAGPPAPQRDAALLGEINLGEGR